MATIYDLSERELFQLKAIDPHLSGGWQQVLFQILPKLDKNNQLIVNEDVLAPRGIFYNREQKKFQVKPVNSLQSLLMTGKIYNKDIIRLMNYMQSILDTANASIPADELADTIESTLSQLNKIEVGENDDPRMIHEVRKAFLYDIAKWVDGINLVVKPGLRKMTAQIAKVYLKEVYIKQQIQGMAFCNWDALDLEFIDGFPDWVRYGVKTRQCFVVETPQFWFLVGQAEKMEQNPFSFRRFLYEDDGGGIYKAFVNHVAIPRPLLNNLNVVELMKRSIGRIYTLDNVISEAVRKFVYQMQTCQNNQLVPLLRQPLVNDGRDTEQIIFERMIAYEKQITQSILLHLPRLIQNVAVKENDQNFLFYSLDKVIKQMIESVENFRLQPITRFSVAAESMSIKLASFNLLLGKIKETVCNTGYSEEQKTKAITEPLDMLTAELVAVSEEFEEFAEYREQLINYQLKEQQSKGFLSRLVLGRAPDYTLADIEEEESQVASNFFLFIVRLAKQKRKLIVYPEFEFYKSFDDSHRHYAFANGAMGISRLPKLVRLPEDRSRFNIASVQRVVYFDAIKGFNRVVSKSNS